MPPNTYDTYRNYDEVYIAPDEKEPYPRKIQRLFRENVRGSCLDIGCADGRKLKHLVTHCSGVAEVLAIDPSATLCEQARARLSKHKNVRVENVSLDDLSSVSTAGGFDTITMLEVIEHMEDQQSALRHVFDHLNPGGVFICSTPNRRIYGLHCRLTGERRDPTHVHELSLREYKALVARFSSEAIYCGFWPFMFLFRKYPWLDVMNAIPGTLYISRTMYCVVMKPVGE